MRHDMQRKAKQFQSIIKIIESMGYGWVWSGDYDTITVRPPANSVVRDRRLFVFSVANYGNKWYMSLQDKNAHLVQIYQIDTLDRAVALITKALTAHDNQSEPLCLDASIILEHELVLMSFSDLVRKQQAAKLENWRKYGWHQLADSERESVWARMSIEFPYYTTGQQPNPSVTWDVSTLLQNIDSVDRELEPDLVDKLLIVMREHTEPNHFLYVMVQDSTSFQFTPHAPIPGAYRDYWAVSPLPGSDTIYFLFPNFESGLISDWRGTICVFGQHFLASVKSLSPTILAKSRILL